MWPHGTVHIYFKGVLNITTLGSVSSLCGIGMYYTWRLEHSEDLEPGHKPGSFLQDQRTHIMGAIYHIL